MNDRDLNTQQTTPHILTALRAKARKEDSKTPYIYKYTDTVDDTVKYVGIIKKDSNFPKRFLQHTRDPWFHDSTWQVEYVYFDTISEVEVLEGHLIAFYETQHWYNKAKATWGMCSFAPDPRTLQWTIYQPGHVKGLLSGDDIDSLHDYVTRLMQSVNDLSTEISWVKHKLYYLEREEEKKARSWAKAFSYHHFDRKYILAYPHKENAVLITDLELFNEYNEFIKEDILNGYDPYRFCDEHELRITLQSLDRGYHISFEKLNEKHRFEHYGVWVIKRDPSNS